MAKGKEKALSYAIVVPFAIALAFPFGWMMITAFKQNSDLYCGTRDLSACSSSPSRSSWLSRRAIHSLGSREESDRPSVSESF